MHLKIVGSCFSTLDLIKIKTFTKRAAVPKGVIKGRPS